MRSVIGARWISSTSARALKSVAPNYHFPISSNHSLSRRYALAGQQSHAMGRRRALSLLFGSAPALASAVDPSYASVSTSVEDKPSDDVVAVVLDAPPTRVTATGRVVAMIEVTPDNKILWSGGDTTLVQLGDVMDRGDNEIAIIKLLRALDEQAKLEGGAVYMLNALGTNASKYSGYPSTLGTQVLNWVPKYPSTLGTQVLWVPMHPSTQSSVHATFVIIPSCKVLLATAPLGGPACTVLLEHASVGTGSMGARMHEPHPTTFLPRFFIASLHCRLATASLVVRVMHGSPYQ
eukprot:gene11300-18937_t